MNLHKISLNIDFILLPLC